MSIKASRTVHACCEDTETNPIVVMSHVIALRHYDMIDSEITSNRCNHIWPCNRSLDGDILHIQNGDLPNDAAQYNIVPALLQIILFALPLLHLVDYLELVSPR